MASDQSDQSEELLHVRVDSEGRIIEPETVSLRTWYLSDQAPWEPRFLGHQSTDCSVPVTFSNEMIRFFLYAFYRRSAEIE